MSDVNIDHQDLLMAQGAFDEAGSKEFEEWLDEIPFTEEEAKAFDKRIAEMCGVDVDQMPGGKVEAGWNAGK